MRALLIVNPVATATTPRVRNVLSSALASETKIDTVVTTGRGHAAELGRQAADDELDLVVVFGGDGTINEAINGILADGPGPGRPALAVVPGGSTNVFVRALGLPNDPVEAVGALLESLRNGRRRWVGLGRADERFFTFNAGFGLDADAVRLVERARARGRRSTPYLYAVSAARRFARTDRRHGAITLQRPGAPPLDGLFLAIASNTAPWTYVGRRPLTLTPTASFDTGLDVIALDRMGVAGTLLAAARTFTRGGIRGRQVHVLTDLDEVSLYALRPLPLQLDGDYLGERSRVTLQAVPRAVSVVCGGGVTNTTP